MPRLIVGFVRVVDAVNRRVGRLVMYGIFVLAGILLWSSLSKVLSDEPRELVAAHAEWLLPYWVDGPSIWTLEMAQFAMVAYYILGGPYSIQMGSNVRMDLFYGEWSPRRKAWFDAFTVLFLIFFLGVLFHGGMLSAAYSLGYFGTDRYAFFAELAGAFFTGGPDAVAEVTGHMERTATAWRPFLWPIKLIMCLGFLLMILQALAELFRDIGRIRGVEL